MILVNDKQVEFTKFPDGTTSFRFSPHLPPRMFAQPMESPIFSITLYTDYTAFQSCLKRIKLTVPAGETIAMPFKIGCGLGGGDWNVILGLIQKELSDKYTVELWRKEV